MDVENEQVSLRSGVCAAVKSMISVLVVMGGSIVLSISSEKTDESMQVE